MEPGSLSVLTQESFSPLGSSQSALCRGCILASLPALCSSFATLHLPTVFSWLLVGRMGIHSSRPAPTCPAKVGRGDALPPGFSSHTVHRSSQRPV